MIYSLEISGLEVLAVEVKTLLFGFYFHFKEDVRAARLLSRQSVQLIISCIPSFGSSS